MIRRGDIRWFRFAAPDKRRPVIVLGRDELLDALAQVPVVPLSTQVRGLAWEVLLTPEDGIVDACVAKVEWIRSVDRTLLGPRLGSFPVARWGDLRRALLHVLGLDAT